MHATLRASLSLVLLVGCRSTELTVDWSRTYGGPVDEQGRSVASAPDGGLVFCGWTRSSGAGGSDAWVVRTDADGTPRWERTYGTGGDDDASAVVATRDGGFAVAGSVSSGGGDAWLARLAADGTPLWERTFGGAQFDRGESQVVAADGGFLMCGGTRSSGAGGLDALVVRTDADGLTLWERVLGGEAFDRLSTAAATPDGGFALAGQTSSQGAGSIDFWLVRLDDAGQVLWERTYGTDRPDWGESLVPLPDGGFVLCGERQHEDETWDAWIVRVDAAGAVVWETLLGGEKDEWLNDVARGPDGTLHFCGITGSEGAGNYDAWFLRLDAEGSVRASRPWGGADHDNAHSVLALEDGGAVACGRTNSEGAGAEDAWLLRLR